MDAPIQTPIDPVNPSVTQAEESGSLSDFAAKYDTTTRRESPEADEGSEVLDRRQTARPSRSRGADDHETISALTKRLREAESQIGVNTDRLEGESDRAFNLRLRAEAAEAVAKKSSERQELPKIAQPVAQPSAFTDKEPTIEQFADQADPYSAWQRALNAWDRKKERFDDDQKKVTAFSEERMKAARELRANAEKAHYGRIEAYKKTTPDYDTVVGAAKDWAATPLMQIALVNDPNGEKYIYHLAQNRSLWNRLVLDSDGKVVTRETVEAFQDVLKERMPAVTGSAHTPATVNYPPPPPNPVRTGRMRSSSSEPPDTDHMSLDEFAKATTRGRRR